MYILPYDGFENSPSSDGFGDFWSRVTKRGNIESGRISDDNLKDFYSIGQPVHIARGGKRGGYVDDWPEWLDLLDRK